VLTPAPLPNLPLHITTPRLVTVVQKRGAFHRKNTAALTMSSSSSSSSSTSTSSNFSSALAPTADAVSCRFTPPTAVAK
jgi:hypothetical protein